MNDLFQKKTAALAKKSSLPLANLYFQNDLVDKMTYFDINSIYDSWKVKKEQKHRHRFLKIVVKPEPIALIHYICYDCGHSPIKIDTDDSIELINISEYYQEFPRILRKAHLDFKKKIIAFSVLTSYRTTAAFKSISQMVISSWKKEVTDLWHKQKEHSHRLLTVIQHVNEKEYSKSICIDCGDEINEKGKEVIDVSGIYHIAPDWLK